MQTTRYFEEAIRRKRPEIQMEWVSRTLENPHDQTRQDNGRYSYWRAIPEFGNRVLRVVTLEDGITVLNAFFDRNYKGAAQ